MTDPVRSALEAAAKAMCGAEEPSKLVRRFIGDCRVEMPLWRSYEADVAYAIAAFLRALPNGLTVRWGDDWQEDLDDEVMAALAAAVEAAGREG